MDLILQRIEAGNGLPLTIVGMTVVFCGLLLLFIVMILLKKVIHKDEGTTDSEVLEAEEKLVTEEINMDEVAAAIGLAFNLHALLNSPKKLTIKRLSRSLWKESQRAKAMERL